MALQADTLSARGCGLARDTALGKAEVRRQILLFNGKDFAAAGRTCKVWSEDHREAELPGVYTIYSNALTSQSRLKLALDEDSEAMSLAGEAAGQSAAIDIIETLLTTLPATQLGVLRGAASRSRIEVAEWLIRRGEGVSLEDLWGAIYASCSGGHLRFAQWMWDHYKGLDPHWATDGSLGTRSLVALMSACALGHQPLVQWALSALPALPAAFGGGFPALLTAVRRGHLTRISAADSQR